MSSQKLQFTHFHCRVSWDGSARSLAVAFPKKLSYTLTKSFLSLLQEPCFQFYQNPLSPYQIFSSCLPTFLWLLCPGSSFEPFFLSKSFLASLLEHLQTLTCSSVGFERQFEFRDIVPIPPLSNPFQSFTHFSLISQPKFEFKTSIQFIETFTAYRAYAHANIVTLASANMVLRRTLCYFGAS